MCRVYEIITSDFLENGFDTVIEGLLDSVFGLKIELIKRSANFPDITIFKRYYVPA